MLGVAGCRIHVYRKPDIIGSSRGYSWLLYCQVHVTRSRLYPKRYTILNLWIPMVCGLDSKSCSSSLFLPKRFIGFTPRVQLQTWLHGFSSIQKENMAMDFPIKNHYF